MTQREAKAYRAGCVTGFLIAVIGMLFGLFVVGCSAHAEELPAAPKPPAKAHAFFDRTNLALFSADALARSLDAESTRAFMTAPCHCYHEEQIGAIANTGPRMYAFSFAMSGAMMGAAYLAHRTGHHRLERLIPAVDAALVSRTVVSNWRLVGH